MASKSAKYYQSNKAARDYDTEYHKTPARRRYRSLLNAINRKKGTYGNGDGMDESHVSKNKTKQEKASKNRGRKTKFFFGKKS
jgi:hypothetical protein